MWSVNSVAQQAALASRAGELAASAARRGGYLLVTADVGAVGSADALRSLALDATPDLRGGAVAPSKSLRMPAVGLALPAGARAYAP